MHRFQVALAIAVVTASGAAAQQAAAPTGALMGSITDVATGVPIRATVRIDRPRRAVRADSAGHFVFPDLPAGRVQLHATFLGYESIDTAVVVRSNDTVTVTLRVRMLPQSLAPVRTVAKSPERVRFE